MNNLTREAIEGYVPRYAERIPDWTEGAAYWPAHFGTTAAEINNGDWLGDAQDEAAAAALRHLGVANEAAGIVAGHATNAGLEAGGMTWAQQRVTAAIALAEGDGFPVGNDLKPIDPNPSPIPQVQKARDKVRATHEKEIGRLATEMQQESAKIAAQVDQRTADLTGTTRYVQATGMGMGSGFKADPALPLPQPPMPAPVNSPQPPAWPPPGGVPASVANPAGSLSSAHPPAVIAPAPPKPNPKDHDCSVEEIVDGTAKIALGTAGVGPGSAAPPPLDWAAEIGGADLIFDGLSGLSHCTNANDK